ncbi:MAG: hypothetical protein AAF685_13090 [Cyanobacteria bacterium P01_C01_bin.89]
MTSQANTDAKLPPIWLSWTLMTAVGAAIFGALLTLAEGESRALFFWFLIGGLIVGWLEWRTLRLYRIPMGMIWCGVKAGMMLCLFGLIMVGLQFPFDGSALVILPICGFALDGTRWLLLRSHFPQAGRWLSFCALGWLLEVLVFYAAAMLTFNLMNNFSILFFVINGAINGTWMGFCRGIALTKMLGDRHQRTAATFAPTVSP